METFSITGGRTLTRDHGVQAADVAVAGGTLHLDVAAPNTLDATGCLVLPGIVDIHGDAFERQFQPRPGVGFPADIALRDTDAQLLANGITTAFHGITLSWEPGLRGLEAWQRMLAALAAESHVCDMRVHLRWEAYNFAALETALADIAAGRVHLLAFNDHTPEIMERIADDGKCAKYADRAGMSLTQFRALARETASRSGEVDVAQQRIAAAARAAGLPMASHDDATLAERAYFHALGADICEFPMVEEVGRAARAQDDWVIMGSPNVVRGGSHLGWTSAQKMVEAGVCRILSSDYFYPAMARAAFRLIDGGMGLADAWNLISRNPAQAAHLRDRGAIADGLRADLVVVREADRKIIATVAGGRIAHLTAEGFSRLS